MEKRESMTHDGFQKVNLIKCGTTEKVYKAAILTPQ
jgi:hypothetical protein